MDNLSQAHKRSRSLPSFRVLKNKYKGSLYIPFALVGLIVLVIVGFSLRNVYSAKSPTSSAAGQVSLEKAKKTEDLNKTFAFSLRDQTGKEVSKVKYLLKSAEIRDEILVKGQKAYAVEGRTFLILNIKITNSYEKPVQINARDYIRMTVNNNPEKIAPEIHSDPAEVQAISTKETRVGFAINKTDKNLVLQIGEVKGSKETIKLHIQ